MRIFRLVLTCVAVLVVATTTTLSLRPMKRANNPLEVGQCTWYAFERAHEAGWDIKFDHPYGRHAKFWPQRVTNANLGSIPSVGSLMVLDAWKGNPYGHVAFVESVGDKEHWSVSHANMAVGGEFQRRWGVPIRKASVSRRGDFVGFEGHEPNLKLIGFLTPDNS